MTLGCQVDRAKSGMLMTYFLAAEERDSTVTEAFLPVCKHLMNKEATSVLRVRDETSSGQGRAGQDAGCRMF